MEKQDEAEIRRWKRTSQSLFPSLSPCPLYLRGEFSPCPTRRCSNAGLIGESGRSRDRQLGGHFGRFARTSWTGHDGHVAAKAGLAMSSAGGVPRKGGHFVHLGCARRSRARERGDGGSVAVAGTRIRDGVMRVFTCQRTGAAEPVIFVAKQHFLRHNSRGSGGTDSPQRTRRSRRRLFWNAHLR